MVGKFYAIKNEDSIRKGTIISTVFAIIVAGGCYFLGGFGRLFDSPELYSNGKLMTDSIIPKMLSGMPDIVVAVVIILVLSASMSTLSSLVLTSASTLTLDVILPLSKKNVTEKKKLLILRLLIVFFVVISAVIAVIKDTYGFTFIAQMMGVSWGALAGAFLAPFLYGLYWKRTSSAAVGVSFVFGVGIEVIQLLKSMGVLHVNGGFFGLIFTNSLYSGVFAMLGGLVLVPLVSLLCPKKHEKETEEIFTCYDRSVTVDVTECLGNK